MNKTGMEAEKFFREPPGKRRGVTIIIKIIGVVLIFRGKCDMIALKNNGCESITNKK